MGEKAISSLKELAVQRAQAKRNTDQQSVVYNQSFKTAQEKVEDYFLNAQETITFLRLDSKTTDQALEANQVAYEAVMRQLSATNELIQKPLSDRLDFEFSLMERK